MELKDRFTVTGSSVAKTAMSLLLTGTAAGSRLSKRYIPVVDASLNGRCRGSPILTQSLLNLASVSTPDQQSLLNLASVSTPDQFAQVVNNFKYGSGLAGAQCIGTSSTQGYLPVADGKCSTFNLRRVMTSSPCEVCRHARLPFSQPAPWPP